MNTQRMNKRALLVLALAAAAACGDSPAGGAGVGGEAGSSSTCPDDAGGMPYVAGMSVKGTSLELALIEASPAPPARGDNRWTVEVRKQGTTVVAPVTWTVTPFMPLHGHGSSIKAEVTATDAAGQYRIEPLNFWMPGLWEITFGIQTEGDTDEIALAFCVDQ